MINAYPNINIAMVLGQLPSRKIAPNPKTNPNANPNPNPYWGVISLWCNCPDTTAIFEL